MRRLFESADIERVLVDEAAITRRVRELGAELGLDVLRVEPLEGPVPDC